MLKFKFLFVVLAFGVFLMVSCEHADEKIIEESESIEKTSSIPDSLAVYVMDGKQRIKSTKYRLLTNKELELLIEKGWWWPQNNGNRVDNCRWADQTAILWIVEAERQGVGLYMPQLTKYV